MTDPIRRLANLVALKGWPTPLKPEHLPHKSIRTTELEPGLWSLYAIEDGMPSMPVLVINHPSEEAP